MNIRNLLITMEEAEFAGIIGTLQLAKSNLESSIEKMTKLGLENDGWAEANVARSQIIHLQAFLREVAGKHNAAKQQLQTLNHACGGGDEIHQ